MNSYFARENGWSGYQSYSMPMPVNMPINMFYNKINGTLNRNLSEETTSENNSNILEKANEIIQTNENKTQNILKEQFGCQICLNVLYSPNITKCCGETACYNCFNINWSRNCPFCKIQNFKIMPNFKIQKMKEMIIKKFNIVIDKDILIKGAGNTFSVSKSQINKNTFPFRVNINLKLSPHLQILNDAKFFIIKSFNIENILISQQYNQWATTKQNQIKLNEVFKYNFVVLIFSVNKSGCFQGYAVMTSDAHNNTSSKDSRESIWRVDNNFRLGGSFGIKWLSTCEVPFSKFKNIRNPLNDNEPVAKSRDTQELPVDIGVKICETCYNFNNSNIDVNIDNILKEISKSKYLSRNTEKNKDNKYKERKNSDLINKKRKRSDTKSSYDY